MRLIAALGAATIVYLAIGVAVGIRPRWHRLRRPTGRSRLTSWLEAAGVAARPWQFLLVSIGAGAVIGAVVLLATGVGPLAVVAGLSACVGPRYAHERNRRRQRRARLTAWPDALRDLIANLRSSLSLHAALVELGRSGPSGLRPVFERYGRLASALEPRLALGVIRDELADSLSDRVIEVLIVAFDQGASVVVDILVDLADATVDDLRLVEEIETAQLETRLEARGAVVLPFLVLGLLCATSDDYRQFYASAAGWLVIAAGGAMSLAGVLVIGRLGSMPAEERILAGRTS